MTQEQFDEWIAALEDPKVKKGKFRLKNKEGGLCCLGVLAEINNVPCREIDETRMYMFKSDNTLREASSIPPEGWMGMDWIAQDAVMDLNDNNDTFKPVIEYLKENKKEFVKEE